MRTLLVEDEQLLGSSIKTGLSDEGFVVDWVTDGMSGLWAATENSYDVIVLDIMVPRLNGYKLLETLRAREIWTPVLMLTAKSGEYDQTDAFELGADDYLIKPFHLIVLAAHLRALIRRGAPARPTTLKVGTLTLDPAKRKVARGETPIRLTAREFGLLLYLMRNTGDVLSKPDILDNVWDPAYEGGDNVVEVYIGYLRRKIDQPFGLSTLQNVRGMGYRLVADDEATTEENPRS